MGGGGAWRARAFGGAAALDVDFATLDRPTTVTSLLATCVTDDEGRVVDADRAWEWTLNERLRALIATRLASAGAAIELHVTCARCAGAMEIAIDLNDLSGDAPVSSFAWQSDDGVDVTLRLPRGRDVRRWMHDGVTSHHAIAASLVESVGGLPAVARDVPPSWLPALDDAFEAHDPLTALRLHTRCPSCDYEMSVGCDLERMLLDDFARMQATLLRDVARLAAVFHWTEAEILALPSWRRARYLRQLDGDAWSVDA